MGWKIAIFVTELEREKNDNVSEKVHSSIVSGPLAGVRWRAYNPHSISTVKQDKQRLLDTLK
jgi:hypothetical protein